MRASGIESLYANLIFFFPFDLELLLLFFLARSSNRPRVFSGVRFVLGNRLIYVRKCELRLLLSDCCLTK